MSTSPQLLTITLSLASALTWGAADFSGGMATKRAATTLVVLFSQMVGFCALLLLALLFGEAVPNGRFLLYGALAGVFGMVGLVALYHGLGSGQMGVVAPVAALVTAVIPILFAFFQEGVPQPLTLLGIGLALVAVWVLSANGEKGRPTRRDVVLGGTAGVGLGLFLTFIELSSETAVFWPLVAGRAASVTLLGLFVTARRGWQRPAPSAWRPIVLAGLFDATGNALFALATQYGRLDIAAILSSLYPASTILLARLLLNERLLRLQWVGVGLALVALVLIAL